ncbi:hypothetical protein TREMEDRAFT_70041 [Tremella mesenterica DSM 1558]|uniref:uncharacterized protein n=1 Tax=Tremella mesenterica (strain ATCC 24925 / CBS 8224 / DSM 1558 / NBRC 9311 / NRRL Y-6157 / RJB 2259-6 / UBC 559-6) TaxID=578456 RepID=UPI00032BCBF6|nr:uncharacterized protein TREMEDRAFT_70041 [Tremella mesenterica DSM 1558]EIW66773.1 hypothetical protein TREMEDRAFT_70041 [Tremella mesenterica DSM 1558]
MNLAVSALPKKILYLIVIFFLLYWFGIRHGLGIERIPPPPLGFSIPGGRRGRHSSLIWGKTGMVTLIHSRFTEHPFYELMEKAEDNWNHLISTQSKSLEQAYNQYRKRYNIKPPIGFDSWFLFNQQNDIKIKDEFNFLMKDLLPHLSLKPEIFIKRSEELENKPFTYTLEIDKEKPTIVKGPRAKNFRPGQMKEMIDSFKEWLPDGFKLKITGSDHDTGSQVLGRDQRERAMELVKMGKYFDDEELEKLEDPDRTPAWGWFKACPLDSPANIRPGAENATNEILPKTFIYDHLPTMDFCDFPELKRLHGAMSIDWKNRSPSVLKPALILSKFPADSSFQVTPMEGYQNLTQESLDELPSWEEKTDNRLFWRGSSTGGYNVHRDWKESHRFRLHLMVNGPKGGDAWWANQARDVIMPDGQGGYKTVRRWDRTLSKAYVDVKVSGKLIACPQEHPDLCETIKNTIEFGQQVWPHQAVAFKYLLDVDGNGWSQRFHRLLGSGSPVIKFTMFPEWHQVVPWYHYIPLKPDYSDLYDIMAFFVGPVDEDGNVDESKGHDYLARKIGEAGQRYALEHWSWADMQSYMFRLLLELQRLHSIDREAYTFKLPSKGKGQ